MARGVRVRGVAWHGGWGVRGEPRVRGVVRDGRGSRWACLEMGAWFEVGVVRDGPLAAEEGRVARDGRAALGGDARLALDDGLQPRDGVGGVGRLAREEEELADGLANTPRELREEERPG